jgi:hypothetical protein
MPHQHDDDVMLTSPVVLLMSIVRHVDFDQFDFLPIWEMVRTRYLSHTMSICEKQLYGRNQCNEPDAMALVSSDSENFDF